MDDKVTFYTQEDNEEIEFKILAETTIHGTNYLLVSGEEEEEEETPAYIMRMVPSADTDEVTLEIVDDDKELKAIGKVFEEILDGVNLVP